jgi:hypothetical protein
MSTIAQRPDFSGEWRLNTQASRLSPAVAPVVRSGTLKILHSERRFASQLAIEFADKQVESKFELVSDGSEVVADHIGQRIVSSLRWDADTLLATWQIHAPDSELAITFRYELQDDGHRRQATEHLRGGGRDQDNVWVFDRP